MSAAATAAQSLHGKVAVITGSSRSIGAAIAARLAADGARVVVNYVSGAAAADGVVAGISAAGGTAVAIQADVSSVEGAKKLVDATVEKFGRIDILVLNAGVLKMKALADTDEAMFDQHINVNVKGPFFLAKHAASHLPEGGRVIFFSSSLTGASAVAPEYLTYCITKGAVEQMSRVLAKDLGRRRITVNTVSPGPIDTDMFREGKSDQLIAHIASMNPQNRLGTTADIAAAVSMLAKPEAAWINGQNIRVNGGFVV